MTKILITGSKGQLGQALMGVAMRFPECAIVGYDVDKLDVLDVDAVYGGAKSQGAEVMINCAAYTAVDKAEVEADEAYLLNAKAVEGLTKVCGQLNMLMIHLSTDFVFDGLASAPYTERDQPRPLSVYGASKLAGEAFVLKYGRGVVVRTSWLYALHGHNFMSSILRLGAERDVIEVVNDQIGSPTYAPHLAEALLQMVGQIGRSQEPDSLMGLYHFSNSGSCARFEFAQKIKEVARFKARIEPVPSWTYPTAAPRPAYSALNCEKVARNFGFRLRLWEEGLNDYFNEMRG